MAFDAQLEMQNGIAKITLVGELDAAAAPQFRDQVQQAADAQARRLVLLMDQLQYMASAGLRVLVFAKQKMGADADIYMVGVQPNVRSAIEMTGFHQGVIMLETYDAAQIDAS
jgi:anti-anti-sigma factor